MAVVRVDPQHPNPDVIEEAARLLREGELVAFPTETVYGLGAHALDAAAVARIYEAKGRPGYNPVIVHVANVAQAQKVAATWPESAARLADRFWPGPLTLVLPRRDTVPDIVTAGLPSVGIRVPSHPVALALLERSGLPLAAPSANRFTELSPTRASHVQRTLGDRVAMILDGGTTTVGIESTVLDLTGEVPVLLRPGTISRAALEQVVGTVALPGASPSGDAPRPSPGMIDRHYAPRARVVVFAPEAVPAACAEVAAAWDRREKVAALVLDTKLGLAREVRMPPNPAGYAARLYDVLHELDEEGTSLVLVEDVPVAGEWAGIADRLRRGSALRLVK